MSNVIKPACLKPGDKIALVSPSMPGPAMAPSRISQAVQTLESMGFIIQWAPHARMKHGHHGATIQQRADDINNSFADPDIKAILCTIGGWTANGIIPYLDFEIIRKNPKIFIGYSDITVLHYAIFTQTGMVVFYGSDLVSDLGEFPAPPQYTLDSLSKTLIRPTQDIVIKASKEWTDEPVAKAGEFIAQPRKYQPNDGWKSIRQGKASGILMGGHLGTSDILAGTPYFPDFEGVLWFWEDVGREVGHLDRLLTHFKMLGVLDKIAGMLIGRPCRCPLSTPDMDFEKMVEEVTEGYDFPIIARLDIGHTSPQLTLPIGVKATMNSHSGELIIHEPGVHGE